MTNQTTTIKITDPDSGEATENEECRSCEGMGGADHSSDPEVYDDWHDCEECDGNGFVEVGFYDKDTFVPERDAFRAGD